MSKLTSLKPILTIHANQELKILPLNPDFPEYLE